MEASLVPFVIFKALLGFGLPIAFCVQQLVVTQRALRRDREAAAMAQAADAAPEPAPAINQPRERVLEPA